MPYAYTVHGNVLHNAQRCSDSDFPVQEAHTEDTTDTQPDTSHAVCSCSLPGVRSVALWQISRCSMFAIQALLQLHSDRLEQQQQAQAQQRSSKHIAELQSTVAALKADNEQHMQAAVEQASSKHAGLVAQTQKQLEKIEAMLAAEKQKNASLKVMLRMLVRNVGSLRSMY